MYAPGLLVDSKKEERNRAWWVQLGLRRQDPLAGAGILSTGPGRADPSWLLIAGGLQIARLGLAIPSTLRDWAVTISLCKMIQLSQPLWCEMLLHV